MVKLAIAIAVVSLALTSTFLASPYLLWVMVIAHILKRGVH